MRKLSFLLAALPVLAQENVGLKNTFYMSPGICNEVSIIDPFFCFDHEFSYERCCSVPGGDTECFPDDPNVFLSSPEWKYDPASRLYPTYKRCCQVGCDLEKVVEGEDLLSVDRMHYIRDLIDQWYSTKANAFKQGDLDGQNEEGRWKELYQWSVGVVDQPQWNANACRPAMLQARLLRVEFELLNVTRHFIHDVEPFGAGGESLTYYFAKLAETDEMGADYSEWHLAAGESRVWEAYSEYNNMVKRIHYQDMDNCGCSHGGWDYYRGLRGSHEALLLEHLDNKLFEQTNSYEYADVKQNFVSIITISIILRI